MNIASKKQRRPHTGEVLSNAFSSFLGGSGSGGGATTASGKKSKAQPRSQVRVKEKGIGPIRDPNCNDVLCGRGGRINSHEGNIKFRDLVNSTKKKYLSESTKKLEKAHIAAKLVEKIRAMNPPGRFLKEEDNSGLWYDIGDARAFKKVGQALREDAPEIRDELDDVKVKKESITSSDTKIAPSTKSSARVQVQISPPKASLVGSTSQGEFQQVLPGSTTTKTHVALPMDSGVPSSTGGMYPPQKQFKAGKSSRSPKISQSAMAMMDNPDEAFGRHFSPPIEMTFDHTEKSEVSGLSALSDGLTQSETQPTGRQFVASLHHVSNANALSAQNHVHLMEHQQHQQQQQQQQQQLNQYMINQAMAQQLAQPIGLQMTHQQYQQQIHSQLSQSGIDPMLLQQQQQQVYPETIMETNDNFSMFSGQRSVNSFVSHRRANSETDVNSLMRMDMYSKDGSRFDRPNGAEWANDIASVKSMGTFASSLFGGQSRGGYGSVVSRGNPSNHGAMSIASMSLNSIGHSFAGNSLAGNSLGAHSLASAASDVSDQLRALDLRVDPRFNMEF